MTIAQPQPARTAETLIAAMIGAATAPATTAPAAPRPRPRPAVVCHIRREDECTITYCDRLTAPCDDPADEAPIAMASGRDVAVYADVEWATGARPCPYCREAYYAAH